MQNSQFIPTKFSKIAYKILKSYVDSATGETSVPMQTMVKWAQTEADPDPDEP